MPNTLTADTVGPVDVAVIAFDNSRFNGDVAPALRELQDSGTVRILDLTFLRKDGDGSVDVVELSDSDVALAFERVTGDEFDLLSDEDLASVGAGMEPGSSAMVVVWENTWAARLGAALRGSHGRVVLLERIPRDAVLQAITSLDKD
ncbi:DUF6325 family protein [Streptacidiphilus albus]|uniref:DUF6325 family protein n=1 Tax=Streptacidiphilus albus TaxID=105425 RepID=UPI00054B2CBB|nr:DUF6325 family protein [Streptacidiphilus albus]